MPLHEIKISNVFTVSETRKSEDQIKIENMRPGEEIKLQLRDSEASTLHGIEDQKKSVKHLSIILNRASARRSDGRRYSYKTTPDLVAIVKLSLDPVSKRPMGELKWLVSLVNDLEEGESLIVSKDEIASVHGNLVHALGSALRTRYGPGMFRLQPGDEFVKVTRVGSDKRAAKQKRILIYRELEALEPGEHLRISSNDMSWRLLKQRITGWKRDHDIIFDARRIPDGFIVTRRS